MSKYKKITLIVSLVLLSILVFYVGDQFSFGNKTPLETLLSRFIFVSLIWGFFGFFWFWKKYQIKKSENALINQLSSSEDIVSNEDKQIQEKFIQALKSLRSNKKFSINDGGLYQKPWYMLIGAPGSGKTTTLVNSTLGFADSHELSKQAIQGVGGTRLCDWWFTNEATLIDTAGRFTAQESDVTRDKAAWQSFIQGLKKNRPLQPINGVIVFLSVSDLLSEEERLKNLRNIKLRLKELSQYLSIKIPVYIIINKMDLLLGFNEFFSALNQDARNQIFGVTLSYGASINSNISLLQEQLQKIYIDLDNKKIDLLESEVNLVNKSKVLLFPERYKLLTSLINKTFVELSLEENFFDNVDVRGFYFTSATQFGSPIDNILNNAGFLPVDANKNLLTPPIGKAFFINDLLKKLIFLEAGLVAKNKFLDAKKIWYLSYLVIPLVFLVLIGVWSFSYIKTKSQITQIEMDYQRINLLKKQVDASNIVSLNEYLDELRVFKEKNNEVYQSLPLNGLGVNTLNLYSQQIDYAYIQSLKIALAQILFKEIENKLSQDKNNYLLLKAYLLLADDNKYKVDTEPLAKILVDDIFSKKNNLGEKQRLALIKNIDKLLQERPLILYTQLNQELIKDVRFNIKANGFVDVVYGVLQESIDKDIKDWSLLKELNNKSVFVISGQKNNDIIMPAFFTREAFNKIKDTYLEKSIDFLERDSSWVLDMEPNSYTMSRKELRVLVMDKYLKNYHQKWLSLLENLSLIDSHSINENLAIVKSLSIEDGGELKKLIDSVIKQTILTQNITSNQITGMVDKISSILVAENIHKQAKEIVDNNFLSLANLLYLPESKKDLDAFVILIKEVESQLYLLEETSKKGQPLPDMTPLQVKIMTASNTMPAPLSNILKGFYINIGQLSKGAANQGMKKQLAEISATCQKLIKEAYPFSKISTKDVSFMDMGNTFSTQGFLFEFFNKNLNTLVDKSNEIWRPIPSTDGVNISQNVVANFQRADNIRKGFFQTNIAQPYFSFTLHWLSVPPELLMQQASISIDGQQFIIQPNNTQVINWPALPGGNHVVIDVNGDNLSGYKFEGPWAILRFIDKGNPIYENNGQKIKLKWNTGMGILTAEILSINPNHPFIPNDLEKFSCVME